MKLIIFFFAIFIGGILLVMDNAFKQGSMAAVLGCGLVFSSIVGLAFSIAYPIKEKFVLNEKKWNWVVTGLIVVLVLISSLIYNLFFEYQEKKLNEKGKYVYGQVDSLAYERRGKLALNNYFYYSYKVNGYTFTRSTKNTCDFESFRKILIQYDPENPDNHKILKE